MEQSTFRVKGMYTMVKPLGKFVSFLFLKSNPNICFDKCIHIFASSYKNKKRKIRDVHKYIKDEGLQELEGEVDYDLQLIEDEFNRFLDEIWADLQQEGRFKYSFYILIVNHKSI